MSTDTHWLKLRGDLFGPFNLDDLKRMTDTGEIVLTDEVSVDKVIWWPVWQTLGMPPPEVRPAQPAPITGFSTLERGQPSVSKSRAETNPYRVFVVLFMVLAVVSGFVSWQLSAAAMSSASFCILLYEVRAIRNALKK